MAFKHIQSNDVVYLLSNDGIPTDVTIGTDIIPSGSLSIDINDPKVYILKLNGTWEPLGEGGGTIGEVITVYQTPQVPSGTSSWIFPIGTGTNVLYPLENTMYFYVNTQKTVINNDWIYDIIPQEIRWVSISYGLETDDIIEIYYQTKLPV